MSTQTLPAGLIDSQVEFFRLNDEPFFLCDGRVNSFNEMSCNLAELLRKEMDNDPRIDDVLESMNITDSVEQLKKFVLCRFCGDFDKVPDLSDSGVFIPQYANCELDECQGKNILCKYPQAPYGQLTRREIQIIKLIGQDLPDKIIADRLNIAIPTIAQHRTHIERKIGCHSKVGIAVFAKEHDII